MIRKGVTQELKRIANKHNGFLNPVDVVKVARDPKSILHSYFTWDDKKASELRRLDEAGHLIRFSIEVMPHTTEPVRVFVSLPMDRGTGVVYRQMVNVLSDSELRIQLLNSAIRELESFQKKYSNLKELMTVFKEINIISKKNGVKH